MTELFSEDFREIYSPYDGQPHGGWQLGGDGCRGHLWHSCRAQTWSATGYLGAIISGVFGVAPCEEGLKIAPCVPEILERRKDAVEQGTLLTREEILNSTAARSAAEQLREHGYIIPKAVKF